MSSEVATTMPPTPHLWQRIPYYRAVLTYSAIRLVTLSLVAITNLFSHNGIVKDLSTWDGAWFLRAIYRGYPSHLPMIDGHVAANPIALFPLFPLCIRGLSDVTRLSAPVVGLWLSALSGVVAVIAIGALSEEFTDRDRAQRAALLFAVAPGSFVFSLIYNEGVVISLLAFGLLALLRRRWLVAGVIGAFASAASPIGLVFAATAALSSVVAISNRRDWRSMVAPLLAPIGFVAWMGYLWAHTGTLRAWQLTERGGWNSYPSIWYPFRILAKFITNPLSPTMTGQILFFGTLVSILGLIVLYREHLPIEVTTYATLAVFLFAISQPVGLRPRFVMLAFPLAIAAAMRWSGTKYRLLVVVSLILLALMSYETLTSYAVFP